MVHAHLGKDSGRLVLNYVESFVTTGAEAGRYKMTTQFKNKKPVYMLAGMLIGIFGMTKTKKFGFVPVEAFQKITHIYKMKVACHNMVNIQMMTLVHTSKQQ